MTATQEARVQTAGSEVITPTLRRSARRSIFWIVIAIIIAIFAVLSLLAAGAPPSTTRLSATNTKPNGAEALVSVLRTDGVEVQAPRTLGAAIRDASQNVPDTTIVLYDPTSILDADQLGNLAQVAPNLILIEPSKAELANVVPGVTRAGAVAPSASADCSYRPVQRAGEVTGLAQGYRVDDSTGVQRCLGGDGVYSLVRATYPDETVTVLGATTPFTNASIADSGNAALALGVFGSTKRVVWYLPSFADEASIVPDGSIPAPQWVSLIAALIVLVVVAAGVWRGRRLGAMVVERMPVTVRASETLEGRARLYQKSSARGHALDALRVGTISRLAVLCGLPTLATVDEVIATVASLTGRTGPELRALLLDDVPGSDRQLVRLSDDLRVLEDEVARAVAPR